MTQDVAVEALVDTKQVQQVRHDLFRHGATPRHSLRAVAKERRSSCRLRDAARQDLPLHETELEEFELDFHGKCH